MILHKHSPNDFDVSWPIAQVTSELALHAACRLLSDESDGAVGITLFADPSRSARRAEVSRMMHYLENTAIESGSPPDPKTALWLLEKSL